MSSRQTRIPQVRAWLQVVLPGNKRKRENNNNRTVKVSVGSHDRQPEKKEELHVPVATWQRERGEENEGGRVERRFCDERRKEGRTKLLQVRGLGWQMRPIV